MSTEGSFRVAKDWVVRVAEEIEYVERRSITGRELAATRTDLQDESFWSTMAEANEQAAWLNESRPGKYAEVSVHQIWGEQ